MKIMVLDDDCEALGEIIKQAAPKSEIALFTSGVDALKYIQENDCEVAFLPIGDGGKYLARDMLNNCPFLNVIFTTQRAFVAAGIFDMHISGCLKKPLSVERVQFELGDLRYKPNTPLRPLQVTTFGNFEVRLNNNPLPLRGKAKELFAYLVDRAGAVVTNNEIYGTLYEDEPGHEENLKKIKKSLADTLNGLGLENVLNVQRGGMGINPDSFDCDLYAWRRGDPAARASYRGEYMAQYSWAEYTISDFENNGKKTD